MEKSTHMQMSLSLTLIPTPNQVYLFAIHSTDYDCQGRPICMYAPLLFAHKHI